MTSEIYISTKHKSCKILPPSHQVIYAHLQSPWTCHEATLLATPWAAIGRPPLSHVGPTHQPRHCPMSKSKAPHRAVHHHLLQCGALHLPCQLRDDRSRTALVRHRHRFPATMESSENRKSFLMVSSPPFRHVVYTTAVAVATWYEKPPPCPSPAVTSITNMSNYFQTPPMLWLYGNQHTQFSLDWWPEIALAGQSD